MIDCFCGSTKIKGTMLQVRKELVFFVNCSNCEINLSYQKPKPKWWIEKI